MRLSGIEPAVRFLPNSQWLLVVSPTQLSPFQVGSDGATLTARTPASGAFGNYAVVQVGAR